MEGRINTLLQQEVPGAHLALGIGSEIELDLFSEAFNPRIHGTGYNVRMNGNPNYTRSHRDAVRGFAGDAERQLARVLQSSDPATVERIFMELSTNPGTVADYIQAMQAIQQYVMTASARYHINPVVLSQHIHLSLADSLSGRNILEDEDTMKVVQKGLLDAYHRGLPLLRLPEEVEARWSRNYGTGTYGYGMHINGTERSTRDPRRIEGRLNSSEYMFDPYINLVIHLIGIYRGLLYQHDPKQINRDYPLKEEVERVNRAYDIPERRYPYFTIGGGELSFKDAVVHLRHDRVMREFFPEDVLDVLCGRAMHYWEISEGGKTVAQVREDVKESSSLRRPAIISLLNFPRRIAAWLSRTD